MLRIVNSAGITLAVAQDQTITVEKRNPLFNDPDKFFQDISYPFTAPLTDNNKAFFKLGHLLESSSSLYIIPVQFFSEEVLMVTGNLRYSVTTDGFECTLEPNLTAINYLLKNIYVTDIRTLDSDLVTGSTTAGLNALMLDTCNNPGKYNYVFIPIKNEHLGPSGKASRGYINFFSYDDQAFKSEAGGVNYALANTPHFKLKYILQNISRYLGLTPDGDFFEDPFYDNIYVYSRRAFNDGLVYPSMRYMPYTLIGDTLKMLRKRWHLAIDINLSKATMTVRTLRSIRRSPEAVDLSPWLIKIVEHGLSDTKGYSVTLKPDEQDNAQASGEDDKKQYLPEYIMTVGDGSTKEEIECGWIKVVEESTSNGNKKQIAMVDQLMSNSAFDEYDRMGNRIYNFPLNDPWNYNSGNLWPWRFFRYNGMIEKEPGKYWPDAATCHLDQDDAAFYKLMQDGKKITVEVAMPPAILSEMKVTDKVAIKTEDGNYVYALIDYFAYDKSGDEELVPCKFYLRDLNSDELTTVTIEPNIAIIGPTGFYQLYTFRAFFDKEIHGFDKLVLQVSMTGTADPVVDIYPISIPTNYKGTGGQRVGLYERDAHNGANFELRVTQGRPKFAEYKGQRLEFQYDAFGQYYELALPAPDGRLEDDYWICF